LALKFWGTNDDDDDVDDDSTNFADIICFSGWMDGKEKPFSCHEIFGIIQLTKSNGRSGLTFKASVVTTLAAAACWGRRKKTRSRFQHTFVEE